VVSPFWRNLAIFSQKKRSTAQHLRETKVWDEFGVETEDQFKDNSNGVEIGVR
jgi:hypothetical protein